MSLQTVRKCDGVAIVEHAVKRCPVSVHFFDFPLYLCVQSTNIYPGPLCSLHLHLTTNLLRDHPRPPRQDFPDLSHQCGFLSGYLRRLTKSLKIHEKGQRENSEGDYRAIAEGVLV